MKHSNDLVRFINVVALLTIILSLAGCYGTKVSNDRSPAAESTSSQTSQTNSEIAPLLPSINLNDISKIAQEFKAHFLEQFQLFKERVSKFLTKFFTQISAAKNNDPKMSQAPEVDLSPPTKPVPKSNARTTSKPGEKPKNTTTPEVKKDVVAPRVSSTASKFRYANPSSPTKMRTHPSQVRDLRNVRKRSQIPKIPGIGFSFGGETVFKNNVALMNDSHYSSKGLKGRDLLRALQDYSRGGACIPTLLLAGHGWGSPIAVNGKRIDAIARNHIDRNNGLGFYLRHSKASAFSVEGALAQNIENNQIKFCGDCEIIVHACNISKAFASSLSKTTGCRVVAADFQVSPVTPKPSDSWSSFPDDGRYDHIWFTSARGNFFEYLPDGRRAIIGKGFIFDPEI